MNVKTINTVRIKADIVARGIACPGSCALILNLIHSIDPLKYRKKISEHVPWMNEVISMS